MQAITIAEEFAAQFAGSRATHEQAAAVLPGGMSHDVRRMRPFPLFVEHAQGARKWDVDGHELIDYQMGHGALLLGHGHPAIAEAVVRQAGRGMHLGAGHPLEIEWARQVVSLVPSAARVRFTSSGTEASLLAMQLARAYTGREKVLKFAYHFHGWHDAAHVGVDLPPEQPLPGISRHTQQAMVVAPINDTGYAERALVEDGDIAAVILEPSGAGWGGIPLPAGTLERLRDATNRHGALLIFDEVVTGFRWAPGGVQERSGITPDLTILGKILAGGMPGGAVAGREEVMALLEFRDDPAAGGRSVSNDVPREGRWRKVSHPGTHNAHPVSAAAGVACLWLIADGQAQRQADATAAQLRAGLNAILRGMGVPGVTYGQSSGFHLLLGVDVPEQQSGDVSDPGLDPLVLKRGLAPDLSTALHCGMLLEGVHLFRGRGLLSTAHTAREVDQTLAAFEKTLHRMRGEGLL